MTFIAYTREERGTINKGWSKLMTYNEDNSSKRDTELADALNEQRRKSGNDLIGTRGQLLGLLVRAGDIRFDRLYMYLPPARTVIAYSWYQHRKFMEGEDYSTSGVTWDDVLVAAQAAEEAYNQYLTRRHKVLNAEVKP